MSRTSQIKAINRSAGFSLADKRILRGIVNQSSDTSAIADAVVAHDVNTVFSDTEVEAALDALGGKINLILAALSE